MTITRIFVTFSALALIFSGSVAAAGLDTAKFGTIIKRQGFSSILVCQKPDLAQLYHQAMAADAAGDHEAWKTIELAEIENAKAGGEPICISIDTGSRVAIDYHLIANQMSCIREIGKNATRGCYYATDNVIAPE